MKTLNSLQEVSNELNKKYSKISDFEMKADGDRVLGGFYKMNYNGTPQGEYFFREVFCRISPSHNVNSFNDVFDYCERSIQRQLKEQKSFDESYAAEYNKPVVYKFDYSLIKK